MLESGRRQSKSVEAETRSRQVEVGGSGGSSRVEEARGSSWKLWKQTCVKKLSHADGQGGRRTITTSMLLLLLLLLLEEYAIMTPNFHFGIIWFFSMEADVVESRASKAMHSKHTEQSKAKQEPRNDASLDDKSLGGRHERKALN